MHRHASTQHIHVHKVREISHNINSSVILTCVMSGDFFGVFFKLFYTSEYKLSVVNTYYSMTR